MKQSRHELVFIPFPVVGHFTSAMEIAKLITLRDPRFSVTIFVMKFPFGSIDADQDTGSDSIRLVPLPAAELSSGPGHLLSDCVKANVPLVRDAVRVHLATRPAGFFVDVFCTHMIDVAHELGVLPYLLFPSGAACLGFMLHVQFLHDHGGLDLDEFKGSDTELEVPSFSNPVPGKVFPSSLLDKEGGGAEAVLYHIRRFREVKGILVNTFLELESHAVHSLSEDTVLPTVYPLGPILKTGPDRGPQNDCAVIMRWLDDQPPSSVVFLCFGSMGAFGVDQIKEIAHGLERSGYRFLWSLRCAPQSGVLQLPTDYKNTEDVLPNGFLDRTAEIGKVIGWAPQTAVLAHPAIGGFVSHCGWNSTLESIWHGVPMATWPLYAEQQLNAFQLVKDLGLAVAIKMDYTKNSDYVVSGEEIESGLKKLMNMESEARKKMEEMEKISRKVMIEGASSHLSMSRFIEDMVSSQESIQPSKKVTLNCGA